MSCVGVLGLLGGRAVHGARHFSRGRRRPVDIDFDAPDSKITHALVRGNKVPLADHRARYSRHTDVVVARLDHYCSWVGNPIGARNYFSYVAFLAWATLNLLVVGLASGRRLLTLARSKHSAARVSPLAVVGLALLGTYCFMVMLWTGGLLAYQVDQVSRNVTSIEKVKKTWRDGNPHDRGCWRNWLGFCRAAPPSYVLELDQVEGRALWSTSPAATSSGARRLSRGASHHSHVTCSCNVKRDPKRRHRSVISGPLDSGRVLQPLKKLLSNVKRHRRRPNSHVSSP